MFPVSIEITRHERLPTPWECEYATGRFPGRDPNFLLVVYVVSWAELQPSLRLQPNLCRSSELLHNGAFATPVCRSQLIFILSFCI